MKICVIYKEAFQQQKPSYTYIIKAKRAEELFHMDVVRLISLIGHNRVRFIVYGVNNVFRMHFRECIKEKEEVFKTLRAWAIYFKNCMGYNV